MVNETISINADNRGELCSPTKIMFIGTINP